MIGKPNIVGLMIPIAATVILLTGCIGSKLIAEQATPRSISIKYDHVLQSGAAAANMAEAHCLKYDRHAQLSGAYQTGGGLTVEVYDCVL